MAARFESDTSSRILCDMATSSMIIDFARPSLLPEGATPIRSNSIPFSEDVASKYALICSFIFRNITMLSGLATLPSSISLVQGSGKQSDSSRLRSSRFTCPRTCFFRNAPFFFYHRKDGTIHTGQLPSLSICHLSHGRISGVSE